MLTFDELQVQPFMFQKIARMVPEVWAIDRNGPWCVKSGNFTFMVLGYSYKASLVLVESLAKWPKQPPHLFINYTNGPCLLYNQTDHLIQNKPNPFKPL